jgi:hypothetical protein
MELGLGLGAARGEESDLVAAEDEALGERVDDALGPTIALGRDLDVKRADLCDPHECGANTSLLATRPPF